MEFKNGDTVGWKRGHVIFTKDACQTLRNISVT